MQRGRIYVTAKRKMPTKGDGKAMRILVENTLEVVPLPEHLGEVLLVFTREGLDVEVLQPKDRRPFRDAVYYP